VYLLLVCCKEDELMFGTFAGAEFSLRSKPLLEPIVIGIGTNCCAIEAEPGVPATTDAHDELGLTAGRRVEPPDDAL